MLLIWFMSSKNLPEGSKAEIAQYFANQIPTEPSATSQESSGQHSFFENGYSANDPAGVSGLPRFTRRRS